MVASDARARISALEEELKRKEMDHVRQLASLVRAGGATALPPELTVRGLGSFLKRKNLRKLAKLYRAVASSPLFDEKWYIANNPDVVSKKMDAVLHYLYYGSKHHRPPGPNFDTKSYLEENPDVGSDGLDALTHFLSRGHREGRPLKRLEVDRVENQLETFLQSNVSLSLAVPFRYLSESSPDRRSVAAQRMSDQRPIAALVHIFHEELADEMRRYLERIPSRVDVFISTTDSKKKVKIEKTFANWDLGAVDVQIVANRGRDLAPILVRFKDVIRSYDLMLHMHSKRSSHSPDSFLWRRYLFETLFGDVPTIESLLDAFRQNQTLGMVGASHFAQIRNFISWGLNFKKARELGDRIGFELKERGPLDFPSGSMFWARTAALRPLIDLDLTEDDFEIEQGQLDGTLAHVIEHLFYYCCEWAGFTWARISRPEFLLNPASALDVPDPTYVDRFFYRYDLKLLREIATKAPGAQASPRSPGLQSSPAIRSRTD